MLDQRGIADRFLAKGTTVQALTFGSTVLDLSDFPTRHPYTLGIWQNEIERIMGDWVAELPVRVYYGHEAVGLVPHVSRVGVQLADGTAATARYVVGCDGGRSMVRKAAGIDFPGWEPSKSSLIAEVELTDEPHAGSITTRWGSPASTSWKTGRPSGSS